MERARGGWRALLGLSLLACLWLAPLLRAPAELLLVWRPALFSDLLLSHLPISKFVNAAVTSWGQLPLWNPLWLGGQPLLADPLAAMLYPPQWLTFIWPSLTAYNLLLWLHLVWSGFGLYLLCRRLGLQPLAAFAAAGAWTGTPKLLGTIGLGHVTLLYAVSWTPWLLLTVRLAAASVVGGRTSLPRAARVGGVAGLIFLADPRWLLPAGMLAAAYGIVILVAQPPQRRLGRQSLIGGGVAGAVALSLAAGLALPLFEFVGHSTRTALTAAAAGALNVSAADLLGLLYPDPLHWPETNVAVGAVVATLALAALLRGERGRWFWAAVALASWTLALGNEGPLYPLLSRWLPGAGLLRVPARFQLLAALSASVLAGCGLNDALSAGSGSSPTKRLRLGLVGWFALSAALLAGLIYLTDGQFLFGRPGVGLALLGTGLSVWWLLQGSERRRRFAYGLGALLVLELAWLNAAGLEARPARAHVPEAVTGELAGSWGQARAFSPSYTLPASWAVEHQVELAGGVHPLQLHDHWHFMAQAVGYDSEPYSETLPPFPAGRPQLPGYPELDGDRLGMLNVRWIVSGYPVTGTGLEPIGRWDRVWLYRNRGLRPRAWLQPQNGLAVDGPWEPVEGIRWSPNRVQVRAQGPGLLVLAQNGYPGWQARVDGVRTGVVEIGGVLLAVELGPGEHEVVFVYRPRTVLAGVLLMLFGLLGWLWLELRT